MSGDLDLSERNPSFRADAAAASADEVPNPPLGTSAKPPASSPDTGSPLRVVTAAEFGAVVEDGAAAILGTPDSPLIPEGGNVMVYGDGGVGKTTLTVDLAYHLAAGDDWLAIANPRPRRVLLTECEGPRPLFRRKIARKDSHWAGSPVEGRVLVCEEPWARFTFAGLDWRRRIADRIAELKIDVFVVGPITGAGMDTPGTIQDCREFVELVDDVRGRCGRAELAIVLIHHENRVGKVSGAWEGVVDTLLHVTGQGHGKLRLYVQKAKWASDLHATGLQLAWAPGDSFTVEDKPELDDETLAQLILDAIRVEPGTGSTRLEGQITGVGNDEIRRVRDQLLREGAIVNIGKDEHGADVALDRCLERRAAHLYLADDPTIRHLRRDPGADAAQSAPAGGEGTSEPLRRAPGPIGAHGVAAQTDTPLRLDETELARELENEGRP